MILIVVLFIFILLSVIFLFQLIKVKEKLIKIEQQKFEEYYKEKLYKIQERIQEDTLLIKQNYESICKETEKSLNKLNNINKEISQKINFNENLKKIREEELDRLFEEKKKEKEKTLIEQIARQEEELHRGLREKLELWTDQTEQEKEKLQKQVEEILSELNEYKKKREVINQAIIREKEIQEQENFYKINISKSDIEDIKTLEQIRPRLKNREALSKLIWEVFIRRECQEMIKRVTSGRKVCGIYKITYTKTGEAYIGKTTDIQTRWQNHIKTTIGLDGCAHSTFHTRMEKDGFWNYTFEILEEVEKEKLSEREKYWIKFYDTTHIGLNQKEG